MAEVDAVVVCSSVLPWRSCGSTDPWIGATTAAKTAGTVAAIDNAASTVWGGDWNHALSGPEWAGSQEGRWFILDIVGRVGLQVPTATSPHRIHGLLSIDHVAIPADWTVVGLEHHPAAYDGARISDHDAYVVEVG